MFFFLVVCSGVLDIGGGGPGLSNPESEVMATQKYAVIARVLANPPSGGKYGDLEKYYQFICPQLLDILALKVLKKKSIFLDK